jgi:hypothetical protein
MQAWWSCPPKVDDGVKDVPRFQVRSDDRTLKVSTLATS